MDDSNENGTKESVKDSNDNDMEESNGSDMDGSNQSDMEEDNYSSVEEGNKSGIESNDSGMDDGDTNDSASIDSDSDESDTFLLENWLITQSFSEVLHSRRAVKDLKGLITQRKAFFTCMANNSSTPNNEFCDLLVQKMAGLFLNVQETAKDWLEDIEHHLDLLF